MEITDMNGRGLHFSFGPSRAATGRFPFANHRTMEEVMAYDGDKRHRLDVGLVLRRYRMRDRL